MTVFSIPTPLLENGDRLSRTEFERRYTAMPAKTKAELIEGIVYVPAALRFRRHGRPHALLMAWLSDYWLATLGVELGDNSTVRLDLDNAPQPDAVLFLPTELGGQCRISDDDYLEGAPELIVEVAASSASIDLHAKKQAYRRNGVQEYIVWQVLDRQFNWFYLNNGEYNCLTVDADSLIRSRVFPGLWLAVDDLLADNMTPVLAGLQQGLRSPEYVAFAKVLATKL